MQPILVSTIFVFFFSLVSHANAKWDGIINFNASIDSLVQEIKSEERLKDKLKKAVQFHEKIIAHRLSLIKKNNLSLAEKKLLLYIDQFKTRLVYHSLDFKNFSKDDCSIQLKKMYQEKNKPSGKIVSAICN